MQFTTLALAALTSLASAQKTWVVTVAQNGTQTFSPNNIVAQPGEMVQFQFHSGNHTVTQSTFDQPCQPVAMNSNATGFHSGFLPAAASVAMGMIPTYTIQINNTNPLWLYCAQGPHCKNGMVMVINQPAGNPAKTFETYKAAAAKVNTAVVPGGAAGAGGQTGSTTPSTTDGAPAPTQSLGGAGMLTVPGTVALIAAAGAALLL
ncbi:hypothetical protein C8A00DRAFT_44355 [Chaetomidium leptoderma]|uniref:Extracellular serine-rich protein n=1 Tax=Chaetomidium leptoderma TaxID=669021 RepID=A0AAN6ZXM2_9PEZI|nr:hypothetical protein C8A00DRAFT_44355 [Chaetomidium leptoderma]